LDLLNASPRPFRRRVLVNTAWTGVANIWAIVLTLISLPLLLHGLGTVAFGTWALVQTFSAITGWLSLVDLGVGTAAIRAIATRASLDDRQGVVTSITSALACFAALGLACAAVLAVVGPAFLPGLFKTPSALRGAVRFAVVLFAVQVFVDLLTEGLEACLEGLQRVDLSRAVDAFRRTGVAAATSAIALAGGGLRGVAAASLAASAGGFVVGMAVLGPRLGASNRLRPSFTEIRSLLAYGRTVALLRPLGVIQRTMDRLIVGAVLGPAAVALVEIATQVQNGADAVLSATTYSVVPTSSWLRARGDEDSLEELLLSGTRYSLLVVLPVVALASTLAGPLIRLWVGAGYSAAGGLAVVGLLTVALAAPLQLGSSLLLGVGRARAILRAAATALAVNLSASLLLVHLVGIVGVFEGTALGTAVLIPLLGRPILVEVGVSARRFLRVAVVPTVIPTAALAVVTGAVVAFHLPDLTTVIAGTLAGGAVYVVVVSRVALQPGEFRKLKEAVIGRR
jgi:O-antigen/teichoic acid export membrane protein